MDAISVLAQEQVLEVAFPMLCGVETETSSMTTLDRSVQHNS
jgi:hypothetical protein